MRKDLEFATIDHDARGQPKQKFGEGTEVPPRAIYGFAGVLALNVMALFKQLAFAKAAEWPVGNDTVEDTSSGKAKSSSQTVSFQAAQNTSGHDDNSSGEIKPTRFHASGNSDLQMTETPPLPHLSNWREQLHAASPTTAHANDNAALRLPLDKHGSSHATARSGGGGGSDRSVTESHDSDENTDGEKPENDASESGDDDNSDGGVSIGRNRAPIILAPVNLGQLTLNTALLVSLADLLAHSADLDGDALDVANLHASSGLLQDNGNGTWLFVPQVDDTTDVTFTYDVTDGTDAAAQIAKLDFVDLPQEANQDSDGVDVITGSSNSDVIAAGSGSDAIIVMAGHDIVDAGSGNDVVLGGEGNDIIDAGRGNDIVFAGSGNDIVFGGSGDDILFGENGNDELHGGSGSDHIYGGAGDDIAIGDSGDDILVASTQSQLSAGAKPGSTVASIEAAVESEKHDIVEAGGAETANEEALGDTTFGKLGLDSGNSDMISPLQVATDGNDIYDGGEGCDTIDISATSANAIVDLSKGFATSNEIGIDILANIENVVCGSGNDTLIASDSKNELTGGAGADTFIFLDATDALTISEQCDTITDFEVGDRIDISHMDAVDSEDGQQLFKWKGESEKFESAGEIRYKYENRDDGDHTVVSGNTDDDGDDEFMIDLIGWIQLTQVDLIGVY